MTGVLVLTAALAAATALGLLYRARNGRIRVSAGMEQDDQLLDELPAAVRAGIDGSPVTLLQLSTTFCAPCRRTRVLLDDLAGRTLGLRHVDIDLTERPELAGRLRVHSTPTTLALDGTGRELFRFSGVPKPDALLNALEAYL